MNAIRSQSPPGRFLELDTSEGTVGSWIEVDNERAIEKTCQTLRKKHNSNGKIISSSVLKIKFQDKSQSKYLFNKSDFSMDNSSLSSTTLSSIECKFNPNCQLFGEKTKENIKTKELQTTMKKEQNPKFDLSVHNDVIVANLQKYYREEHIWSPLDNYISQSLHEFNKIPSNYDMKILNCEDIILESNEPIHKKRCIVQEDNEFDDDILRMIMDLEHDNTIENDITTCY